jgi:GNAT superfamily N-acetyltransferase
MMSLSVLPLDQDFPLLCRPALPKDTPDVLELTRTIWEGHDYIPYVWEDWLKDAEGTLTVVEYGGRVVGLGKITLLSPGQWWKEGLRVHPDFQGRGIASHLHKYQEDYFERFGDGVIRLATASFRVPVHRLCDRTGYQKIGEFSIFGASSLAETVDSFQPVSSEAIPEAWEFALQSPSLSLSCGLMDMGWKWATPTVARLETAAQLQRVWRWRGDTGLLTFGEDEDDEGVKALVVQLLACPLEHMADCLLDFRRMAASLGYAKVGWIAPLHPIALTALEIAGYQREWSDSLFLYEKKHPVI